MPLLIIIVIWVIISVISNYNRKKASYPNNLHIRSVVSQNKVASSSPSSYQRKGYEKTKYYSHSTTSKKIISRADHDLPLNFQLTEEFSNAFDLMENYQHHIFITGKAGTGKSTLLKYFRSKTKKKIVVLAPTGIAAINVNGQTLHSFFGLPIGYVDKHQIRLRWRSAELFKNLNTVVIDEVSMVRADVLDGIDFCLRMLRNKKDVPFGGVQMIYFGDLFQLPPVIDDRELKEFFEKEHGTEYFFSAKAFRNFDPKPKYLELGKIYRQTDRTFINLLNGIRNKEIDEGRLYVLNQRVDADILADKDHAVTLTTTNQDAMVINVNRLSSIQNKEYLYEAIIKGNFDEKSYPVEPLLKLKKNAQVMLVKNDPNKKWVNGTIGQISNLSESHIDVDVNGCIYSIPRVVWQKTKYFYDREKKKIEQEVIGSFEQYPVKLAWAITIHKSQGQTFDKAVIDFGNGAFTHGQVYVALSRCRTIEGISLSRPITYSDIIFDARIYGYREKFVKHYLDYINQTCSCGKTLRFPNENGQVTCPSCRQSFNHNPA